MDRFHVKPVTFDDLFDFIDYTRVKSLVDKFNASIDKIEQEIKKWQVKTSTLLLPSLISQLT